MDFINTLTKNRITHGFYSKDYSRYFSFIRTLRKDPKYKSEYFLTRFYLSRTNKRLMKKYIKKALNHSKETDIYSSYISGIFYASIDNQRALKDFQDARLLARSNFLFVKDIDEKMVTLCSATPEKIKIDWNGLSLEFVNDDELEAFKNHIKINGNDYQTIIKNHIMLLERRSNELKNYSTRNLSGFKNTFEKCKKLKECVDSFLKYLTENFVDNQYIFIFSKDLAEIFAFYENIFKFQNCDLKVKGKIEDFKVPSNFEYMKDAIDHAKEHKYITLAKAKEVIGKEIEDTFKVETNKIKIPFLPVYYDLAYDYVQYPREEEGKVNKLLKGMSFFKK